MYLRSEAIHLTGTTAYDIEEIRESHSAMSPRHPVVSDHLKPSTLAYRADCIESESRHLTHDATGVSGADLLVGRDVNSTQVGIGDPGQVNVPRSRRLAIGSAGRSLVASGMRVTVEARVFDETTGVDELEVSVITEANEVSGPRFARGRLVAGFSHEDALFRTKWGWAAYDEAKRAAREAAARTP